MEALGAAAINFLEEKSRRVWSRSRTKSGFLGRGSFMHNILVFSVNFFKFISFAACSTHCNMKDKWKEVSVLYSMTRDRSGNNNNVKDSLDQIQH